MKTTRILSAALITAALFTTLAPQAKAVTFPDFNYTVTLDLSSLAGNPDGPYSLDFQFVTGSGNVSNTVKLFNFSFVGGTAASTPDFITGGASGLIGTNGIVTLTNTSSDNEFAALLSSGVTQIKFNVDETPNAEVVGSGTPTPDQFNLAVLDSNLNNIATTDISGGNTLLNSPLGTTGIVNTFSSVSPDGGVTVVAATPEPVSGWLGLVAAVASGALLRLRRRQA